MPLPVLLTQLITHRPQRIALLQHVAEQGSITQAAKAAGISYKTAWDAIDELNNLAGRPLVERSTGGRGGGGAPLSAEGERMVRLYQRLQTLQAQVLEAAEQAGDLDVLGRLMLRTSARNQLPAQVSGLQREGRHDRIHLSLAGGLAITASITHDSTERLELTVGSNVVALFKAGWVRLLGDDEQPDPHCNCLRAKLQTILADPADASEVGVLLENGQTLCAFAEARWLAERQLGPGDELRVQFHPAQVLLGVPV